VFALLCYEGFLIFVLLCSVIVRVLILTKYNSLADKIERGGTATEATVGSFEAI
jgi:hypothetical protein